MFQITARKITAAEFAPFGEVLRNDGPDKRAYTALPFQAEPPTNPRLWVSGGMPEASLPLIITQMERHPWSAQTFVPLTPTRYLVVVAEAAADGSPDPATLRAFIASGEGICYRRNVWHHGMTILDPGAQFVVMMATAGHEDDDVFLDLAAPVEIV